MAMRGENPVGTFLKERRARLDPRAFGFGTERRRTPGLRREEVALRAGVSVKWYTFLEQGRGGAPSVQVLKRLADALQLTLDEREHLFHLADHRLSEAVHRPAEVTPRLRRMIDALEDAPAIVKTPTWDIVAWNRAATVALTDYGALPPERRNLLRLLFSEPGARARVADWEEHARFAVSAFRLETSRGGGDAAAALVEELSGSSPEFAALWRGNDVRAHGEGTKRIVHSAVGQLTFEYSTLAVDGQPGLGLLVFTPATAEDRARVRALVRGPSSYKP